MLDRSSTSAELQARSWIDAFGHSLKSEEADATSRLFRTDSHWRNLCGLSWHMATISGSQKLSDTLRRRAREVAAARFEVDSRLLAPRNALVAGVEVIEAIFRFSTINGAGVGVVRLVPADRGAAVPMAWTISTLLDIEQAGVTRWNHAPLCDDRDTAPPSRLDRRVQTGLQDHEPDVLVVGGGHAGISAGVELKRMGLDALVIDRHQRIGDNWRLRYDSLKLHNKTPVNHLRYLPFPPSWPDFIPKDMLADWLETYVERMDLEFWTGTTFEGAEYNEATQSWTAKIRRGDGSVLALFPKHIVMATSVSGTPNIPDIATIENFAGKILHSSQFAGAREWSGKSVVVMGSGTSAHDLCQHLHANGAEVTMVQRSPTLVVNIDPGAQLYDRSYLGEGPSVDVRDLLNASVPLPVVKASHKLITKEVRALDAALLSRLQRAGFRLDFGEDGTGWPLKFRTRGGGYYFNAGCSDLIADRKIRLVQASAIEQFVPGGLQLKDGSSLSADLVVLATGYKGHDHIVNSLFGPEVAARVGPIWGFDSETQELRNMWTRTGQPGLWFTGGAFSQCRIYSRFIALQIEAIESGRLEKAVAAAGLRGERI